MSIAMLDGFDDDQPIQDILHLIWRNTFVYVAANLAEFRYTEQFSNSPYSELVDKFRLQESLGPILRVIQRGIDQKIIKNVNLDIIAAFMFHPIMVLTNQNHCIFSEPTELNIETAFHMAWDVLRL